MSKFDCRRFDDAYSKGTYTLNVDEGVLVEGGAYVWIGGAGMTVAHEDAPAVALAILEAAGYERHATTSNVEIEVLAGLKLMAGQLAAKKAEAEDAAKLDEEAKALAAVRDFSKWENLTDSGKTFWREVARAARELHKGDAK
jgi:hypothetical protein